MYNISALKGIIITEKAKSMLNCSSKNSRVAFWVDRLATKDVIAAAIEKVSGFKVSTVRTLACGVPSSVRFRKGYGKRKLYKKAYVDFVGQVDVSLFGLVQE